jgi:hypothetical protein
MVSVRFVTGMNTMRMLYRFADQLMVIGSANSTHSAGNIAETINFSLRVIRFGTALTHLRKEYSTWSHMPVIGTTCML